MIGTFINIGAILVGGLLGNLLGNHLPTRLKQTVIAGLGLFVFGLGLQMFLKTQNTLVVLGGLLIGGLAGEWFKIEDGLQNLGAFFERWLIKPQAQEAPSGSNNFIRGFLTASLLFCVGPMAILGSLQDGLTGDHNLLVVKSILDGFAALAFASSLGLGVLFSVLVILVYQGGISLLASQIQFLFSDSMMNEMTAVGGIILIGIALSNLLEIKKIRTGSFLPALVVTPLIVAIIAIISR